MATLGKAWYVMCRGLTDENHFITSPSTRRYNCIAWAAGIALRRWDPNIPYFWPKGLDRDSRPVTLINLFAQLGYVECTSNALEDGFEKVAIYVKDGEWSHAARQKPDGKWTSKLGHLQDIDHDHPECLAGLEYGEVVQIMKRESLTKSRKKTARKRSKPTKRQKQ